MPTSPTTVVPKTVWLTGACVLIGIAASVLSGSIGVGLFAGVAAYPLVLCSYAALKTAGFADVWWVKALRSRPWVGAREGLIRLERLLPSATFFDAHGRRHAGPGIIVRCSPQTKKLLDREFGGLLEDLVVTRWKSFLQDNDVKIVGTGPVQVVFDLAPLPNWIFRVVPLAQPSAARASASATLPLSAVAVPTAAAPGATPTAAATTAGAVPDDLDGTVLEDVSDPEPSSGVALTTDGESTWSGATVVRVGRGAHCELRLPANPRISREHAVFQKEGDQWWLLPKGTNPIMLNGDRTDGEKTRLSDGDRISWGAAADAPYSIVSIGVGA